MKNPTRAPAPRQRTVRREIRALVDMPWVRRIVQCGRAGLLAFVLSAAASGNTPLPLALGFLVGLDADWTVLAAAGGSCAGYLLFWGPEACLEPMAGIVAGLLAAALFAGTELRRRAWFLPALCGAMTAVLGLVFLLARGMVDSSGFVGFLLRVGCAAGSAAVFRQVRTQRGTLADACAGAMLVLGLCQVVWFRVLDLGLVSAAFLACMGTGTAGLPTVALCGLAVDLSRITSVPVTPALCAGFLCGSLLARRSRILPFLCPALWSLPAMYVAGTFDPHVFLGLGVGGLAAGLLPARGRPGSSTVAAAPPQEVASRLETAAGVLEYLQDLLSRELPGAASQDTAALYDQAANTVCRSCTRWETCWNREAEQTYALLNGAAPRLLDQRYIGPEDLPPAFLDRCRRPEAFLESINGALSGLRLRRQCRARLREGRMALGNQYRFLARYLQDTAQSLTEPEPQARYRVELGVASAGRFGLLASGDRGAHFPGPGLRYYVLLCDGMGTGPGAAQESESALRILTGLLQAGMPGAEALGTLNDLYVLRETGGFSTADLLELHLDTGRASLYKWGAAPSYLKPLLPVPPGGRTLRSAPQGMDQEGELCKKMGCTACQSSPKGITIFSLFSFGSGKQGTKEKQTLSRLLLIGQPGTWSVSGSEPLPSGPGLPGPDYIPAAKPSAAPGDCPPSRWSKGLPHSTPHRTVQPQRSVRTSSHCEQNQPLEVRPSSVSCSAGYVRNWIATIYPRINAEAPPGTMAVQHPKKHPSLQFRFLSNSFSHLLLPDFDIIFQLM